MLRISLADQPILIRRFSLDDAMQLSAYLYNLSPATQRRFAPHGYTREAILDCYQHDAAFGSFIAIDTKQERIIGYAVFRQGLFTHDLKRYTAYAILPDAAVCMNYAPSVADDWQGKGLGKHLLQAVTQTAKAADMQVLVLWGGVQSSNEQAIAYYRKNGFVELGKFVHHGDNLDMYLPL